MCIYKYDILLLLLGHFKSFALKGSQIRSSIFKHFGVIS